MADLADIAQDEMDHLIQSKIRQHRNRPQFSPNKTGKCIACGEDIHPKRLEINPAARMCVECTK
jgi:RNA polymerase-binding transcription factor DksA